MKSLLLLCSLLPACEIKVGLIPFAGNWFVFGDYEINHAQALGEKLCPGEENYLSFYLGEPHPSAILPAHRETRLSTLIVDPLGRANSYTWSLEQIKAKTRTENTLSYPGDEIVKRMERFDYLIYGRPNP